MTSDLDRVQSAINSSLPRDHSDGCLLDFVYVLLSTFVMFIVQYFFGIATTVGEVFIVPLEICHRSLTPVCIQAFEFAMWLLWLNVFHTVAERCPPTKIRCLPLADFCLLLLDRLNLHRNMHFVVFPGRKTVW